MSESNLKRQFVRRMIQKGDAREFVDAPSELVKKFSAAYELSHKQTRACPVTEQGRRANHFCLGSDPEFVFVAPLEQRKTYAAALGLLPGLAAGCDQNQRLAELRGYPTRSAVEHVAGLLASLRWMYRVNPQTANYYWFAGAHFDGDGLGGHVHFGRKRPTRALEVQALDGMAQLFRVCGFFDLAAWSRRQEGVGDRLHQRYGLLGDIRPQVHGYEYRTLPSWLDSPIKAFVILTCSKLCVLDPELTIPWIDRVFKSREEARNTLQDLAAYYSGRDDDAWILKHLLAQDEFVTMSSTWERPVLDFKAAWGIPAHPPLLEEPSRILPAVIKPSKAEIQEVLDHITTFKPLTFVAHEPTFRNKLPKGYKWYLRNGPVEGIQYAGAGDLLHDLVIHQDFLVDIRLSGTVMGVSNNFWKAFNREEKTRVKAAFGPGFKVNHDCKSTIFIDRHSMGVSNIENLRYFLLSSGLFPIWTVNSVEEGSLETFIQYRNSCEPKKHQTTPRERIL